MRPSGVDSFGMFWWLPLTVPLVEPQVSSIATSSSLSTQSYTAMVGNIPICQISVASPTQVIFFCGWHARLLLGYISWYYTIYIYILRHYVYIYIYVCVYRYIIIYIRYVYVSRYLKMSSISQFAQCPWSPSVPLAALHQRRRTPIQMMPKTVTREVGRRCSGT